MFMHKEKTKHLRGFCLFLMDFELLYLFFPEFYVIFFYELTELKAAKITACYMVKELWI